MSAAVILLRWKYGSNKSLTGAVCLEIMLIMKLNPPPEYIAHRIQIFDQLKSKYDEEIASMFSFFS